MSIKIYGCFNGAMPFQAWIPRRTKNPIFGRVSFNGAMPFQAWILAMATEVAKGNLKASMGPCPFRHGYHTGQTAFSPG